MTATGDDDDVPLEECSSFLVEEIEIEMQEEQLLPADSAASCHRTAEHEQAALLHDQVEEVVCVSSEEAVTLDTDSPPDEFEAAEAATPPHSSISSSAFVCKWTHCDWPGSYDDLVDHIREIHVELQPYHSLPEQRVAPVAARRGSKCSSTISSCSSYENPASVTSSVSSLSEETSLSGPPATRSHHCQPFANPSQLSACDSIRPSSAAAAAQQQQDKCYVCLWEGCKVYGIRSQKRSWLDRHVLQHSGDKPFKCIVENCGHRFKTQSALERHVNSHFAASNSKDQQNSANSLSLNSDGCSEHGSDDLSRRTTMMRAKSSGSVAGTPCKGGKKKRTRVRKLLVRPSSEDFFDPAIMDVIQFRLFQQHQSVVLQQVSNAHQPQPQKRPLTKHTTLMHSTVSIVHSLPFLLVGREDCIPHHPCV